MVSAVTVRGGEPGVRIGEARHDTYDRDREDDQRKPSTLPSSMPDINALLCTLNEERLQRRGANSETKPALDQNLSVPSAPSLACYSTIPLLVLDLDGTLVDTTCPGTRPGEPSFTVDGRYETRLRPGLHAFLMAVRPHFELAIFTAANAVYAERMVDGIDAAVPGFRASLRCVFSRDRVTFDASGQVTKDLLSLAQHCGHPMCRCLIVDDSPETYRLNKSNALPIPRYNGSGSDQALDCLKRFLLSMPRQGVPLDVRTWPLGPQSAQPLLAEHDLEEDMEKDHGRMLGHACNTRGLGHANSLEVVAPAFLPAFLPPPDDN